MISREKWLLHLHAAWRYLFSSGFQCSRGLTLAGPGHFWIKQTVCEPVPYVYVDFDGNISLNKWPQFCHLLSRPHKKEVPNPSSHNWGEAAPKMVATPQKAPRSAHELSPAPEGGSKSRVRCKPATPSKVATPVKSPDPKKSKTVAPDVVLEVPDDSQGPAAGDEVGSVPKDGSVVEPSTGTCEHGKQGESLRNFIQTPVYPAPFFYWGMC